MSKFGVQKRSFSFQERFKADTKNVAGGTAYTIEHPSVKLLHIVGKPGFNEPSNFYRIPSNPDLARKFKGSLNGLSGQAKLIVEAAVDVARSESPRDLLAIAHWLRKEGHCRQTPQVLLAIAAREGATRAMIRAYAPHIIRRADELMGAYAAYRYLFGKPIPAALLKGIRDAFSNFDEYQLIKYNQPGKTPSMKDVLLQMPGRKAGRPVSRGMAEFIINGSLVDKHGNDHSESAPLVAAYLRFLEAAKDSEFNAEMAKLAEDARVTWEVIVSQFGGSKEVWENVLPRMGYMAVLRNARNLAQAGVDASKVAERLSSRKGILRSKQYPFRFLAALKEIERASINPEAQRVILDSIAQALDISVENVGKVPGRTLILVDCSGSMLWARNSPRSAMNCKEIAACMTGILSKACDAAYVYAFASTAELLGVRSNDSVANIIDKVMRASVGGNTYPYLAMQDAIGRRLEVDRIVLLSDMQCYHPGAGNFQKFLNEYKHKVNRNVWLHSINLNAHDMTSQVASGQRNINLISGFSDKILATLLRAENGEGEIPTLEWIRQNF